MAYHVFDANKIITTKMLPFLSLFLVVGVGWGREDINASVINAGLRQKYNS
jgi:hypothetical protein